VHVIAHRGASATAPEHTTTAYDLALELGADALELDLRATADGALVVLHDPTLQRTAGDPRGVASLRRRDLARLDPAVRPLELAEVLDRYGDRTRLLLECKVRVGAEVVAEAVRRGLRDRIEVLAFDRPTLAAARRADPRVACCASFRRGTPASWVRRELPLLQGLHAIVPFHGAVDAALVAAAHAHGLQVQPYTANDPADVRRLAEAGADAVITDVPDVARLVGAVARAAA
jgi:glycerophosphoryl diester phosphodiesterase